MVLAPGWPGALGGEVRSPANAGVSEAALTMMRTLFKTFLVYTKPFC